MKKFLVSLSLVLLVLGLTGCEINQPTSEGNQSFPVSSPVMDFATDWEEYKNLEYHISFKYPKEIKLEELTGLADNFLQINLTRNQRAQLIVMINGNYKPEKVAEFVGSDPVEEKMIKGSNWYFFDFPDGWSNSAPFTAYQKEGMGYLYSFRFNDPITDELRDQIMETVEILP